MHSKPLLSTSLTLFVVLFVFFGCKSPEKMVDLGNYDEVIRISIQKLAGKKNKNEYLFLNLE